MYHYPMHWIEELLQEQREIAARNAKISSEAPKLYDALRTFLEDDIKRANATHEFQQSIFISGNATLREITITRKPVFIPIFEPKEVHVKLSKDMDAIHISGEVTLVLHVDICESGAVCLKYQDGKEVKRLNDASRAILQPLLFPEITAMKKAAV